MSDVAVGTSVVVYPWLGCGECATCQRGDEHLCVKAARNLGFHLPGGYADTVRAARKYLVPIGGLDPTRAATFACAGITALSAIQAAWASTDEWVAVIGCGGVGMTGLALLSATSPAKIVAIDPDPAKRETALAHGAAMAFDPGAPDALKTINKACDFNVSGVIDFVGSKRARHWPSICPTCGTVVIVGLFGGEFKMPLPTFALKSISIIGSYVGGLNELRELVALAQQQTLPQIPLDRRPLAQVNAALDDLMQAAWWAGYCNPSCLPGRSTAGCC